MTTLQNRPKTALLVIDVQNGVVERAHERDAVVANVGSLVEKARRERIPVVWVQHSDEQLTVRESCIADNGQYGFNAFECTDYGGSDCANQGPGTGTRIQNLVLEGDEIAGNNRGDLETRSPGCGCTGGGDHLPPEQRLREQHLRRRLDLHALRHRSPAELERLAGGAVRAGRREHLHALTRLA